MQAVLNEVYYDPAGADGGYEFVEIVVAEGAATPLPLAGWRLETGNGATPGQWRLAWEGDDRDTLTAAPLVLGESGVEPPPWVVLDLDLQNGPDACRLVAPDGSADVLGWGEELDPLLREGRAAPDVPSGRSLARRPDGLDTQDNQRDFTAADPSPGAFNSPDREWVVLSTDWPPQELEPGASWEFRFTVRNTGRQAWTEPLLVDCAVHPGELLASASPEPALAPGTER
ncbi:MAG TPA: hypothetical protein VKU85_19180, partial [bacterium]|nr:hypothetical protein [bacterium]